MFSRRDSGHTHDESVLSIRSGGQQGVDLGALTAGLKLSPAINIHGLLPVGRLSKGPIPPEIGGHLEEMTLEKFEGKYPGLRHAVETKDEVGIYCPRTEENARQGDATMMFIQDVDRELNGGTLYTLQMADKHNKPVVIVQLQKEDASTILTKDVLVSTHFTDEHGQPFQIQHPENVHVFSVSPESANDMIQSLSNWIIENNIQDLNVGGPNDKKSPGIQAKTENFLNQVLQTYLQKLEEQPAAGMTIG